MNYEVTVPKRKKTVVYREGEQTFVFSATFAGKAVTVFFRHYHDGRLGGEGFLSDDEKRRIAPRVVSALRERGYSVTPDGDTTFNDRWLPVSYKNR